MALQAEVQLADVVQQSAYRDTLVFRLTLVDSGQIVLTEDVTVHKGTQTDIGAFEDSLVEALQDRINRYKAQQGVAKSDEIPTFIASVTARLRL